MVRYFLPTSVYNKQTKKKYCKTMLDCVLGAYSNIPMIVNKALSFIYKEETLLISCYSPSSALSVPYTTLKFNIPIYDQQQSEETYSSGP